MTEWFQERYMSRDEHREIVDYYKKLVAQLHCKIRDLRTQTDTQTIADAFEHGRRLAEGNRKQSLPAVYGQNVIAFDFRRQR